MRYTVVSNFLFAVILSLGCIGVVTPGKADGLKHPINLGMQCAEYFEEFLDWDSRYKVFAYVIGLRGYACSYKESTREALAECNLYRKGECKVYAKSPVNGKVAIVWQEHKKTARLLAAKKAEEAEKKRLEELARKKAEDKERKRRSDLARNAENGDATAQYKLGVFYRTGDNVPQNYKTALKWLRLSAEQGNVAAQFSLGNMYETGQGVPEDHNTALKWYTLAADQGDKFAKMILANAEWQKLAAEQATLKAIEEKKALAKLKAEAEKKRLAELARKKAEEEKARKLAEAKANAEKKRLAELNRKKAEEEKARKLAEAKAEKKRLAELARKKAEEAERKRKANAPDRKLFAKLAPEATTYLADVMGFLKLNRKTPRFLEMTVAAVKLKKSLSTESGEKGAASLGSLKKVAAKSDGFTKFKAKLAAKRKQQKLNQRAKAIADLKIYKQFLSALLLDSLATDDDIGEHLLPIIETVEGGLASKDAAAVAKSLSAIKKQIKANAKINKAFKLAEASLRAEQKRQAELVQKKSEEEKKLARKKAEIEQKRLAELARKKAEEEKARVLEEAKAEAEKKRLAEVARKKAEEEKAKKLVQAKAEAEKKRQAEQARKIAEAKKKRQEELAKAQKQIELEKADYNGKLLFTVRRVENFLKNSFEKDDAGKIISVDTKVGCEYFFRISNYTDEKIFVNRFTINTDKKASFKPADRKTLVSIGGTINPGQSIEKQSQTIISRWLPASRKTAPDESQQAAAISKYGCEAQAGSVYISFGNTKEFIKFSKKRRISKRKIKKLISGNDKGATPLRVIYE